MEGYDPYTILSVDLPKFAASSKAFILYQWVGTVAPSNRIKKWKNGSQIRSQYQTHNHRRVYSDLQVTCHNRNLGNIQSNQSKPSKSHNIMSLRMLLVGQVDFSNIQLVISNL